AGRRQSSRHECAPSRSHQGRPPHRREVEPSAWELSPAGSRRSTHHGARLTVALTPGERCRPHWSNGGRHNGILRRAAPRASASGPKASYLYADYGLELRLAVYLELAERLAGQRDGAAFGPGAEASNPYIA